MKLIAAAAYELAYVTAPAEMPARMIRCSGAWDVVYPTVRTARKDRDPGQKCKGAKPAKPLRDLCQIVLVPGFPALMTGKCKAGGIYRIDDQEPDCGGKAAVRKGLHRQN